MTVSNNFAPSHVNFSSLEKVCFPSTQVMVYGWSHTYYGAVIDSLKEIEEDDTIQTTIQKYFDCWLGNKRKRDSRVTTLEGRKMERIEYDSIPGAEHCAKMCKSAIVNLVLENCKRTKDKLPLIPLLFCIDIDQNPHPSSIGTILSRKDEHNKKITNMELRRIYKICHMNDDFISCVALQTMKFVKVYKNSESKYEFEGLNPFWVDPIWNTLWETRQTEKKHTPKKHDWRLQLIQGVKSYCNSDALGL